MGTSDAGGWVQCGRELSALEIGEICRTVAWLPRLPRTELAATVCEHLDWHTAAGTPKIQACVNLLGRLEAAGLLALPALKPTRVPVGQGAGVVREGYPADDRPVVGALGDVAPVRLEVVTQSAEVARWNDAVARFHPLGYKGAFGYRLRYFICAGAQRLGCVLLAGAARTIAVRDGWIGWSAQARQRNLPWVVNNSRFLIFPHVHIAHLASHVLGQLARRVAADWQHHWGFAPLLLETFVDPSRYRGTCYRAAGWELLGQTSGRGLPRPGKAYHSTPRLVLVKPLQADCRRLLCGAPAGGRLQP